MLATYSENDFINEPDLRLIGVPWQTKQFEIHNLNYENKKFEAESLLTKIDNATIVDYAGTIGTLGTEKRLIQQTKTLFWNENCTQVLPFGEISAQALPYQQQSLELTQELINQFNFENEKITTSLLNDCKYLQDGQDWFAVSEVQSFDKNAFYLPYKITDQFENETLLEYDTYNLFPVKITDALNFETYAEYDYRVLQAKKLTDPNGNSQEVEFDTLGMVVKLAVMGAPPSPPEGGDVCEGDTLQNPTEEYGYDLDCWQEEQKPVFAYVEKRETHGDPNSRKLKSFVYTDGLGNEIMTKTTAADGLAWVAPPSPPSGGEPVQVPCNNRWLASGKVIYNNKGLAIKQYEPWFSDTHEFTFEDELTHYGVTPIMHYDPLGRLIKTDFPDNTTSRVEFDVWQQKNFDQNDCDETSPHYNTPQIIDLDVLGRPFKTSDNLGNNEFVVTENKLDITGRILEVKDALGRTATTNMYALSEKHLLTVDNIDSGKRWILNDTAGKPVKKWDSRGNEFTFNYDELQRPTETVVNGVCTEKLVYGDDALQNNIGQVIESCAQDGKTSFEYDFKGNVVKQTKQFAEDYNTQLDWANSVNLINETFVTETSYDALNRPKSIKQPDETILFYGYDKGGLLATVQRNNTEIHISNIEYNEKGQRLNIYYGNNTKTRYFYNPLNFRLTRILTTRKGTQDKLQDLNYTFDAVGNIIAQTDNAQQTHYYSNSVIAPTSTYEYDALYRLTKATGREKESLGMPTHDDFENNIPCPAANAMQNYTQKYKYDALGNMLQMKSVDNWTRDYVYDTGTNRLLRHNSTQTTDEYEYDTHGNMTKMPHLSTILWNEKDEMTSATNGTFVSYYNYDAQGNRSRKVVVKGNVREERYYINGYEVFRKYDSGALKLERTSLSVYSIKVSKEELPKENENDKPQVITKYEIDTYNRILLLETKTTENGQTITTPATITRYQYSNHLGSACLELDNLGQIISYEEFHPFGTTSYRSGKGEIEVSLKRYKYNGKERDEETGLYYYGARYYTACLCRFTACDPKQFDYPNTNSYCYCFNNPITYTDPNGRDPITGLGEAAFSFAISAGLDFLSSLLLENKEVSKAFSDIGWWSATWEATKTYALASVSIPGSATAAKILKVSKSKIGEVALSVAGNLATKVMDNFKNGEYDVNGSFSMGKFKEELPALFLGVTIETFIEMGFGSSAENLLQTIMKENDVLAKKLTHLENMFKNGESQKRINNYTKKVEDVKEKISKIGSEIVNDNLIDQITITATSEVLNNEAKKLIDKK